VAEVAGLAWLTPLRRTQAQQFPVGGLGVTGIDQPDLAAFDELMVRFVREQQVPGAQLAVSREGSLVYARGFGLADRQQQQPVQPASLFRIASISKPITAVAVLQLAERSKLSLDARIWDLLGLAEPLDARWKRITVLHLLQHTGGWDRSRNFDPMLRSIAIAKALKVASPAGPQHIIRYMLGRPLDFDPGSRHAYSNFGYCLLGRIIERASGADYERYVQREVLAPLGIRRMHLGKTSPAQRAAGEVVYYADRDHTGAATTGTNRHGTPLPYGAWSLEAMDAHGGWLASAPDLVRFAAEFDVPEACRILEPGSIAIMFARPEGEAGYEPGGKPRSVYYGCGWRVRVVGGQRPLNTWHTGHLDGTSALLVRRFDGTNWSVLFNARTAPDGQRLAEKVDPLLHQAASRVRRWPDVDQFAALL
jgi:N-acyl-D-amino-acid deacylase